MPPNALRTAEKWRERINDWDQMFQTKNVLYKRVLSYYNNEFGIGLLPVNVTFSFGRAMIPQLYLKNPTVECNTELVQFRPLMLGLRKVDDRLMALTKWKETVKKMLTNAYLYGRGVCKVGYNDETMDQMMVSQMTGAVPTTEIPFYKLRGAFGPNRPWVSHVYPDDMAFQSDVSELEDSGWMAMRFERRMWEVAADPVYKAAVGEHITDEESDEVMEFWEIWDKHTGKWQTLYDDKWVDEPKDFSVWPFYTLDFNWIPRHPLPVSDAELIIALQDEYNESKTQIMEHRRISVMKILSRKNALDRTAKQQINSGKVAPLVEVDANPQEAVMVFDPKMPMDLYTVANSTLDDIRDTIGFTRNQIGEFQESTPSQGRTAREATIVQQAINIRLDERKDMVLDLTKGVVEAMNDYIIPRWDAQEAMKYGGEACAQWDALKQIQGTYVLSFVPDSTVPISRAVRQQEAKEMYQVLVGDPLIDQFKLRMQFLAAYETADPTLLLPPEIVQQSMGMQQNMEREQAAQGAPDAAV